MNNMPFVAEEPRDALCQKKFVSRCTNVRQIAFGKACMRWMSSKPLKVKVVENSVFIFRYHITSSVIIMYERKQIKRTLNSLEINKNACRW